MADPMYALEKAKREQIREDLRRAARERAALRARVEDADNAIRELVVAGRDAGLSVQECAVAICAASKPSSARISRLCWPISGAAVRVTPGVSE